MNYTYNLPNLSGGIDNALIGFASSSGLPSFIPLILLFIFGTIYIGGCLMQSRKLGGVDYDIWGVVAGLVTLMVSLMLGIQTGLMQVEVIGAVLGVTFLFGLWTFMNRHRNEL